MHSQASLLGDNLDKPIWGAKAIAMEVNRKLRQTFYMLESGELPAKKVGGRWVTTRRRLLEKFNGEAA
jgi:hypothetical protein